MQRRLLSAALLLAASGCPAPTEPCPPLPVTLPGEELRLPLLPGKAPAVSAAVDGAPAELVLGTGLGRTGLGVAVGDTSDLSSLSIELGGLQASQVSATALTGWQPGTGILGLDVLGAVPFVLDARAREVVLPAAFRVSDGHPLVHERPGTCEAPEGQTEAALREAQALRVQVGVEGTERSFVLDTGAESTFLRTEVATALAARAVLEGVWVRTGLLGTLETRAMRVKTLEVAGLAHDNVVVLTGFQVDRALDRLEAGACQDRAGCPRLDGILGWNVLRESRVHLDGQREPGGPRTLRLERFAAQDHWQREFVGLGIYELRSEQPPGIRVDGFYGRSPARDAGLLRHDIIVRVDGTPALEAPSPFAPAGTPVHLEVLRQGQTLTFEVTVEDLLPDVP